jgi:dCMP deaminase
MNEKLILESKPMEKWDERFCNLAKYISDWSKDPNAKVGAVILSKAGGDISVGYNGFPMGVEDTVERLQDQAQKLELIVHAEQNAIIAAGSRAHGACIYVWGKPVCARCAGSIIQAGIKRVVAFASNQSGESKWDKSGQIALQMFKEAGVQVDYYKRIEHDVK